MLTAELPTGEPAIAQQQPQPQFRIGLAGKRRPRAKFRTSSGSLEGPVVAVAGPRAALTPSLFSRGERGVWRFASV